MTLGRIEPARRPAILEARPLFPRPAISEAPARRLWICSGQGNQVKGMGQTLYDRSEVFRDVIHEASNAFREDLSSMGEADTTLMKVMFEGDGLERTPRTQVALLDRKSTRLNSSHSAKSRMPSSA